jgi:hypothetical protein|tara:strand:+ start:4582 stop:4815 length:234 start_codon:yes stop_codon:yes gene_type:complete
MKATDKDLERFGEDLWELIAEHAPPNDHKSKRFMVAGQLLSTALEVYVMSMGREATMQVMEHAMEHVHYGTDKSKLH